MMVMMMISVEQKGRDEDDVFVEESRMFVKRVKKKNLNDERKKRKQMTSLKEKK